MKPTPVDRYVFSQDEVIAALFPSGIPCDSKEIRIVDDEVVIDFVSPRARDPQEVSEAPADDGFPGDIQSAEPEQPPERPHGANEQEATALCAKKAFQTFLEVKTEEAARRILLDRTHAKHFQEFDTVKSWKVNFREIVGEFEAWMMG